MSYLSEVQVVRQLAGVLGDLQVVAAVDVALCGGLGGAEEELAPSFDRGMECEWIKAEHCTGSIQVPNYSIPLLLRLAYSQSARQG